MTLKALGRELPEGWDGDLIAAIQLTQDCEQFLKMHPLAAENACKRFWVRWMLSDVERKIIGRWR